LRSSSNGPEAEQLVDQHLFQRELFAAVQVDLQFGEHLADDGAEFLGEFVLGKRGRGFGVDALEEAGEDLLLDAVDRGFEAFVARIALLADSAIGRAGATWHRGCRLERAELVDLRQLVERRD
jgi:hypothetical protein